MKFRFCFRIDDADGFVDGRIVKGRRILIQGWWLSLLRITWTRSSARHTARERHANLLRFARTGFNLKGNFWNPLQIPSSHFRFVLTFPPSCTRYLFARPLNNLVYPTSSRVNHFVIPRDSRCVTYFVIRARFSNETLSLSTCVLPRKTDPFNLRHDSN